MQITEAEAFFMPAGFSIQLEVEDMAFGLLLPPWVFALWFHHSTPAESKIGCSIALWTDAKSAMREERNFNQLHPVSKEQRPGCGL